MSSLPCGWLGEAACRWPEQELICGPEVLTFAETLQKVEAVAAWMNQQGVSKGDRVLLLMPNRAEVLIIILAALRQGVVFSVLNPLIPVDGVRRIIFQTSPKAVFLDASTRGLAEACDRVPVRFVDEADDLFRARELGETVPEAQVEQEDLAFLVFTSGSTGMPRGVMLTHGNVAFVCRAIMARLQYRETDRIGLFLPLAFDYSLYQLFYACLTGARVFIGQPEMVGPGLPKMLAREKITVLPGVPSVFAGLIKMQRYRPTALPELRMLTSTGDHLPRVHLDFLQELLPQARSFPMFGLTECKRVSILLPEELATHPDSVGRALDGTTVFAVDEEGKRLPASTPGELVVQGPHLAAGYWQAPEETAARYRLVDGVRSLFTGDQGSVDENGYITFHSRSDFVIKHRGVRLNPAEVEDAACLLPGVLGAGCVKDEPKELLCLFLATTAAFILTEAEVLQALDEHLERGKLPDRVYFLPELPRTNNQKLDRKALRGLLLNV